MKIIVGLGNPGAQYANTRHNVGFMVVDYIAKNYQLSFQETKFKALIAKTTLFNETLLLVKPQTYMNLSGEAILAIIQFYKCSINDLLIIYDDLALPTGNIRIRKNGSAGGQNGMKNIIQLLKTDNINRIRIGIDTNKLIPTADYVLSKFTQQQEELILNVVKNSPKIIEDFISKGVDYIMNRYNKK